MRIHNCFLLFVVLLLVVSCFKNKQNSVDNTSENIFIEPLVINGKEEMIDFLNQNEKRIIDRNLEIVFIEKANFGIPEGDNWIVQLSDNLVLIYVINGSKIVKRYSFISDSMERFTSFNIMKDIPGIRIGNSTSSFGDFNGDGIDEIFEYAFGGNAYLITIQGYEEEKDDFVSYTLDSWITFKIINHENGPAPVKFMNYQGMDGFKVFFFATGVAGGQSYASDWNPNNNKWIFYTWDSEQRRYIEAGEVR